MCVYLVYVCVCVRARSSHNVAREIRKCRATRKGNQPRTKLANGTAVIHEDRHQTPHSTFDCRCSFFFLISLVQPTHTHTHIRMFYVSDVFKVYRFKGIYSKAYTLFSQLHVNQLLKITLFRRNTPWNRGLSSDISLRVKSVEFIFFLRKRNVY